MRGIRHAWVARLLAKLCKVRKGINPKVAIGSNYRTIATIAPDCCHNSCLRQCKENKSERAMLHRNATSYAKATSGMGFTAGTLILTPEGAEFVELLNPGDLVMTRDHGPQPLRSLHRSLSPSRAVTIAPQAIGPGLPWRHLRLVPSQRIAMSGWKADLLFGLDETLVPVGDLVSDGTVLARTAIGATVIYQPEFDAAQIIYVEGIEVEVMARARPVLYVTDTADKSDAPRVAL
jgi:hypothetical protein